MTRALAALAALALALAGDRAWAQPFRNAPPAGFDNRAGVPAWEVNPDFSDDVFTFARVRYTSHRGGGDGGGGWGGGGWGGRERWSTDYPDAELNLGFRLQQMTSLKVNPKPAVVTLTQPDLHRYPFLYVVEPGDLVFSEAEVTGLRTYLLNGGFIMFDDFWGEAAWANLSQELARVFPERKLVELELDHPIFNAVFKLAKKPQVPSIGHAMRYRAEGRDWTWEREDAKQPHYRAYLDDRGRIMALICQNTDLGDGWEREGESEWYFREFAEGQAYPLAINIIFHVMTH